MPRSETTLSHSHTIACWPELRAVLAKRGLTTADLARLSGVPYYSISNALLGYRRPTPRVIRLLADALGIAPETITPRARKGGDHAAA